MSEHAKVLAEEAKQLVRRANGLHGSDHPAQYVATADACRAIDRLAALATQQQAETPVAQTETLALLEGADQFATNRSMAVTKEWKAGWNDCLAYVRKVLASPTAATPAANDHLKEVAKEFRAAIPTREGVILAAMIEEGVTCLESHIQAAIDSQPEQTEPDMTLIADPKIRAAAEAYHRTPGGHWFKLQAAIAQAYIAAATPPVAERNSAALSDGQVRDWLLQLSACETVERAIVKFRAILATQANSAAPQPDVLGISGHSTWPKMHPSTESLVRRFSWALADKLAAAEKKYGYSDGWASHDWMDECRAHLMEHIAKGDPRDVAAYCAFLWHHGESTSAPKAEDNSAAPSVQAQERQFQVGDRVRGTYDEDPLTGTITRIGLDKRGRMCAWYRATPTSYEMHDLLTDLMLLTPPKPGSTSGAKGNEK